MPGKESQMKLLEKVRRDEEKDAQVSAIARERYIGLLRKQIDAPESIDAKDQADFQAAIEQLELPLTAVQKDIDTLKLLKSWRDMLDRGNGIMKLREAAAKAIVDHHEETKRIIEQRRRQHYQLNVQQNDLEARFTNAARAIREITKLRQDHGDLCAHAADLKLDD
jgi:hypothetical protein